MLSAICWQFSFHKDETNPWMVNLFCCWLWLSWNKILALISRAQSHRKYHHKSIWTPWIRSGCWAPLEHFHPEVMDFMSMTSPIIFVEHLLTYRVSWLSYWLHFVQCRCLWSSAMQCRQSFFLCNAWNSKRVALWVLLILQDMPHIPLFNLSYQRLFRMVRTCQFFKKNTFQTYDQRIVKVKLLLTSFKRLRSVNFSVV